MYSVSNCELLKHEASTGLIAKEQRGVLPNL